MSSETPFKIAVSDEDIALLKKKLDLTRFPDELQDAGRDYGAPLSDIQRLVAYWKDKYDWRKHEAELNAELPQFTRDIEVEGFGSLNVHYIHKKSSVPTAIPLLFVHGWPGSFLEARKILPLLVQDSPEHPSFHVVAISLPGFGFSEAPKKRGFAIGQYAEVSHKLMLALGYNEYVTQGGDWGAVITRRIAVDYGQKHNKAWHTNMPLTAPPHPWNRPKLFFQHLIARLTPAEKAGIARMQWFRKEGRGYFIEQSTQPQTLGYSLADSPAGLLGWIYEKLLAWTDDYPWTEDEVLTWISIYWFSRSGPTASVRIYYEFTKSNQDLMETISPTNIPIGYSYFPKELANFPRFWLKAPNVVFEAEHESGGHFAAYECPAVLVGDLRKMFGKGGPAFGVVGSHQGFKL
ncbi:alpha/beta-hydrolase [Macrolepiota fuliginosa MF-IS2]|uniref:Alpha/beta-hydrolase n=1 Tax=Macrolepiota fuliginosa MF-IS2 TaxID=1400762 RepID=A0A9P5XKL2_9AGAR|nr:alpha/beta-hydrolase [Macrolepiota fuliginosa MF-IS2]